MHYVVIKVGHEIYIEDHFEGNSLEDAIKNAFEDESRDGMILGNDIIDDPMTVDDMIKWITEDSYEFTTILKSESKIENV